MRKMKYAIIFLMLFMVIGYATVSVSLSITGNANVISDLDDFNVYFSDVKVNDKQDLRLVKNDKELVFEVILNDLGDNYKISYDVTNGSKLFDASLSINCTNGNEYLGVLNEFDTSNLASLSTRTGNLTLTKIQTNSEENQKHFTVTCTIVASPIGKETIGSGTVLNPVKPIELEIGDAIGIDGEYFNIISQTDSTVTMLAQYNLGTDYKQSTTNNHVKFSNSNGWEYTPGPKEIDIQQFDGPVKTYLNEYKTYLQSITGENTLTTDLISVKQLKQLGCSIETDDYSPTNGDTCITSPYESWLVNYQVWWTKSPWNVESSWIESGGDRTIWIVTGRDYPNYPGTLYDGGMWGFNVGDSLYQEGDFEYSYSSVRPVVTISKELAKKHVLLKYDVGWEVSIGSEKFNVIKDNGATVTMLAQWNLGEDYRQTTSSLGFLFADTMTWPVLAGPIDLDIQQHEGNAKTYVNEYVTYLKNETGDTNLTGTLITLTELKELGCNINDYYYNPTDQIFASSKYKSWLHTGTFWWTRSASGNYSNKIWMVVGDGGLYDASYDTTGTIRPVITISKEAL